MNKIEFYSNLAKFQGRNGDAFLKHYGIIGQKWGQRRWQNADGTFNEEGKQRYFGTKTKIGSNNDEAKKQEKINKKVERQVKNKLREIKWHNKSPFSKKIDISEDSLKKYYQAYYDLPWYKRTTKNINNAYLKRFSENVDENTQKGIKKIDDEKNMILINQHMQQINQMNEINRSNNEINQMNMINQINQINQMSMTPAFMGKSSKLKNRYQYENGCLSEEYIEKAQKLANEGKWDELEKLKKKVDFDKVQEWAKKANPDLYKKSELGDPSEYEGDYESYVEDNWEVAAKKRGFDPDNLTNEQSKIIDKDMKDYFNKNEGPDQKIGSSWKSMSDQDYAQVEKDMKKSGWDTDKELKPGNQVYSKPIDNDDYKGIKYEVDAYKFHDNSVDDINKKYQEHINFLNKKDSLKQVLDNFADYEYPYYEKYINNRNKYFDNKLDIISKAEFINAVKSNINLNRTGLSWNDELYMQFVPKENKDFNYFKDMYDVFTVDVDPKSGKISDFTIV